jgi:hypothetical protein
MATRQMLASSIEVQVAEDEFEGNFNSREDDFLLDEEWNDNEEESDF